MKAAPLGSNPGEQGRAPRPEEGRDGTGQKPTTAAWPRELGHPAGVHGPSRDDRDLGQLSLIPISRRLRAVSGDNSCRALPSCPVLSSSAGRRTPPGEASQKPPRDGARSPECRGKRGGRPPRLPLPLAATNYSAPKYYGKHDLLCEHINLLT